MLNWCINKDIVQKLKWIPRISCLLFTIFCEQFSVKKYKSYKQRNSKNQKIIVYKLLLPVKLMVSNKTRKGKTKNRLNFHFRLSPIDFDVYFIF